MRLGEGLGRIFEGRLIAIVLAALVAGTSFALGYFVGKETAGPRTEVVIENSANSPEEISETLPPTPVPEPAEEVEPIRETMKPPPSATKSSPSSAHKPESKPIVRRHEKPESGNGNAVQGDSSQYTIQTGAFNEKADAETLRKKLVKKGYSAYISGPVGNNGSTVYRVRIGKFKNRNEAEVFALRLKKAEGIDSFVTTR